ncbi:tail fiber/spike domain-containing protein [Enterobacter kobei]|uniref:tail fiber/spike domain-containing protein n=1 Tax=Enterobacter kobei TaxID=208224 RepID=UPI0021756780|nr:hypothetical protein [Enterobacter kobei]
MATTPTQNSVPSESPIDLKFNAGKIDEYVTSMGWTYTDRLGQKHYTIEGNNYLAQQAMAAFGYVILTGKTFTTGATINSPNEVLLNTADGEYYKWTGSFASGPKVVPANSTPASTGGIGPGLWIGVGDASLRAALAASTGSALVGHEGHTVGQYLDGVGKMVFPGDDLKVALESASNGDTVIVSGDVTLTQPVVISKAVNIKRVNSGRILWSGTGAAIRYILAVKNTITTPTQFLRSQNTSTLPAGHGVVVGDMLELHSNQVRQADVDGDYTYGQIIYVEKVEGNVITFQPSMTTGFTTSEILVTNALEGMSFDVEIINTKTSTGTAGGLLLDIHAARNLTGKFRIIGNGDDSYGMALQGYKCNIDVDVWNIKSGNFSVPGYGFNCVGDSIYVNLSGGNCRHVGEIPARNIVSNDIWFNCNVTKTFGTPQYIYNVGWHCNVISAKLTGTISGSGFLVCTRSGTGDISMEFNGADDGYDYADISVTDMYPTSVKITNCHSGGANARRSFIQWDVKGGGSNSGGLIVDNNTFVGPKRLIRFYDSSTSTSKSFRAYLSNNKGSAVAIHNRDLPNANVYIELANNTLSSYGLATFADYMAGVDTTGCKTYEVRTTNNNIDDSVTGGVFSFDGYMDVFMLSSQGDKNSNRPYLKLTPSYLGRIDRLDINGLSTTGQITITPVAATVYNDIGQIRFCRIGYDSPTPIVCGLAWPVVYTGNSFKTTLDATLVSTKRPQAGNVNLSGKALNWNGANIAI